MWLFPVTFESPSTPHIDYTPRYAGSGSDMHEVPPVGVPGFAFMSGDRGDFLDQSPVGLAGVGIELAPLPSVDIILATRAALDPSHQMTNVRPAKLAATGMIDAGDLLYGHDRPLLSRRVQVVP